MPKPIGDMANLRRSNSWFEYQTEPLWTKYLLPLKGKINRYIEIGCADGASLYWVMTRLEPDWALAVDPYEPPRQEQRAAYEKYAENMQHNLQPWLADGRLTWIKENSLTYLGCCEFRTLLESKGNEPFDLAFVDGSHYACDLIMDAGHIWPYMRRPGGLVVFDDWQRQTHGGRALVRPGVRAFMVCWDNRYKLFYMEGRHVGLEKIK